MPDERAIRRIEELLADITRLGGQSERTSIVPNLTVVDDTPAGLTNFITVEDDRDGDTILAQKVPGVIYAIGDKVNVLFIEGTEPTAYQQGSQSSGSPVAVSKLVSPDLTIDPVLSADNNGEVTAVNGVSADNFAFIVENTSGAAATANDVGFIDSAGEYQTTTTANDSVAWCVVIIGGANNADIYVSRRGRATVAYTGSAPAKGDFLVTSTTAGDASAQTTMRPEIFAIALAAGSGGTVSALLLTGRETKPFFSANNTLFISGASTSDFVSDIAAAGVVGDKIYYNAPSSGNINAITPVSTAELGKIIIHNTTQTDEAKIIATGTDGTGDFIQVSAAGDISAWIATDVIVTRSQTNTSTGVSSSRFFDIEITSELPELTTQIKLWVSWRDTGGVDERLITHPFAANSNPKRETIISVSTARNYQGLQLQPLIQSRFVVSWESSGAGTANPLFRIYETVIASP